MPGTKRHIKINKKPPQKGGFVFLKTIVYILENYKRSMSKYKRTAREIKVADKLLTNKNINVKIGTVENRDAPETIYIFISFWLQPKDEFKDSEQEYLKTNLDRELGQIYIKNLKKQLENNPFFPREKENIFIKNIPDNLNYNSKRNFISIELYLHTSNLFNENKFPLSVKKDTRLFDEAVKISNIIGEAGILNNQSMFEIQKKST